MTAQISTLISTANRATQTFDGIRQPHRVRAADTSTMQAMVYRSYGGPSVIERADVPKPTPKSNEVLIAIRATTVSSGDWRARSLEMPAGFGFLGRLVFGFTGPRQPILGTEFSGVVEAVGAEVTRFRPATKSSASRVAALAATLNSARCQKTV